MLHELSDLGTSIDAGGPVTPDLIDAVLESNAGVPLLDLGTRDNGHIAPVSPSEIDRFGLPNNTAAVAVWTLFDEFDGEQGSQSVVAALTADEQKHVLDNVTSVVIGAIVRHYEREGTGSGHPAEKLFEIHKRRSSAAGFDNPR